MRMALTASAALALLGTMAACSTEDRGQAHPADSPPGASAQAPFGGMKACDALARAAATVGPGFRPGEPDTIGGPDGCTANRPQNAGGGALGVNLHPSAQYNNMPQVDPATMHQGNVNGRKALLVRGGNASPGSCTISMETGPSSRATVTAAVGNDPEAACRMAEKAAEAVEAQLPKAK